jgi:putative SOS response-associated peptidase YedK
MCYSVAYLEKKLSKLISRYASLLPPEWKPDSLHHLLAEEMPVYYFVSGFSHPQMPLVTASGLKLSGWGLIPFWTKSPATAQKIRSGTLNAVGETVFDKPSFRSSIRQKRCILPVSGFYEWREYRGTKYPYYIQSNDGNLMSLGCIYDEWTNPETGEIIQTFSIITTPANDLLEVIHNRKKRMPLILPVDKEKEWLTPLLNNEEIKSLIKPLDHKKLNAHTVSRQLNYSRNERDTPEAIRPVKYKELTEVFA